MGDLVRRLRELSAHKHSDMTIGDEAADEIKRLRQKVVETEHQRDRALEDYERAMHRGSELEAERDQLYKGLHEIGKQPVPDEITESDPDYECGYECCVNVARRVLIHIKTCPSCRGTGRNVIRDGFKCFDCNGTGLSDLNNPSFYEDEAMSEYANHVITVYESGPDGIKVQWDGRTGAVRVLPDGDWLEPGGGDVLVEDEYCEHGEPITGFCVLCGRIHNA